SLQLVFRLLPRRDVLAHAPVADEASRAIKDRLAGGADPERLAVLDAAELEVVERLVRLEHRPVLAPFLLRKVDVSRVPAMLAEEPLAAQAFAFAAAAREAGEAELVVLLPVHVGGKLGKAAEALLALAQRAVGARLDGREADKLPEPVRAHLILGDE